MYWDVIDNTKLWYDLLDDTFGTFQTSQLWYLSSFPFLVPLKIPYLDTQVKLAA